MPKQFPEMLFAGYWKAARIVVDTEADQQINDCFRKALFFTCKLIPRQLSDHLLQFDPSKTVLMMGDHFFR